MDVSLSDGAGDSGPSAGVRPVTRHAWGYPASAVMGPWCKALPFCSDISPVVCWKAETPPTHKVRRIVSLSRHDLLGFVICPFRAWDLWSTTSRTSLFGFLYPCFSFGSKHAIRPSASLVYQTAITSGCCMIGVSGDILAGRRSS